MKKSVFVFLLFSAIYYGLNAQVGIGTTTPNASLDIQASSASSPTNTDGLLIPKIDDFPTTDPGSNQDGMLVFITGNDTPEKGFYYWDHTATTWIMVKGDGAEKINELTDARSDDDGTNDGSSVFFGVGAGSMDDFSDNQSVGIGYNALQSNVDGRANVAIGSGVLQNNTASFNTAIGFAAMNTNTTGAFNTGLGQAVLYANISGSANTALGSNSLQFNEIGSHNSAIGNQALHLNEGAANSALGSFALRNNTSGIWNVAVGAESMFLIQREVIIPL